jgi:hypothetical protein
MGRDLQSIDTSWFRDMGLKDYVSADERGQVSGMSVIMSGSNVNHIVGFSNEEARCWANN